STDPVAYRGGALSPIKLNSGVKGGREDERKRTKQETS
ncbi:hypothetical protein LCGC14_2982300, partial [marine sediment metagenome]